MRKYGDLLTFLKDLDDLIKYHHGDVRKLREIRVYWRDAKTFYSVSSWG